MPPGKVTVRPTLGSPDSSLDTTVPQDPPRARPKEQRAGDDAQDQSSTLSAEEAVRHIKTIATLRLLYQSLQVPIQLLLFLYLQPTQLDRSLLNRLKTKLK